MPETVVLDDSALRELQEGLLKEELEALENE